MLIPDLAGCKGGMADERAVHVERAMRCKGRLITSHILKPPWLCVFVMRAACMSDGRAAVLLYS